jgi:hypothetical protein
MDGWTQCGSLMPGGGCAIDTVNFDCDDNRPSVFPGNPAGEGAVCDGLDNDCNGTCDDPFDTDGDDVPFCATAPAAAGCEVDCAPDVASVYMGALVPCYRGSSVCMTGQTSCVRMGDGWGLGACDPGISDQTVPPSLCAAYQACVGLPTWATCWEEANLPETTYWACSWPIKNDGALCPGSAPLFSLNAAMGTCTFDHIHATEDTVSITLSEPQECVAELQVTSVDLPLTADWITFVVTQEPALFEARFVQVTPTTVETCPPEIPPCVQMP